VHIDPKSDRDTLYDIIVDRITGAKVAFSDYSHSDCLLTVVARAAFV
jgi:hypothetical protein